MYKYVYVPICKNTYMYMTKPVKPEWANIMIKCQTNNAKTVGLMKTSKSFWACKLVQVGYATSLFKQWKGVINFKIC